MKHEVGNIVYLLHPEKSAVIPARILEQVTKKTISGQEEHFYVEVPGSSNLLNLSDFDGTIFTDAESVKEHLVFTLRKNIESLVEESVKKAEDLWGLSVDKVVKNENKKRTRRKKSKPVEKEETLVDLGDGTVAKLKE